MNLFEGQAPAQGERFEALAQCRNVRIERIVSSAYVDGPPYEQPQDEWVTLLRGNAVVEVQGQPHPLGPGDHLFIAAGQAHRVRSCSADALWLAVHIHPRPPDRPCDVRTGTLKEIAELEACIPEFESPYGEPKLARRIGSRKHLGLIAEVGGQPAGYKLGYEETPERFYSWVGGVVPAYRRRRIARQLLQAQEAWCRAQGYAEIGVMSQNRFRGMVSMLVQTGYDIFATRTDGWITFRKRI